VNLSVARLPVAAVTNGSVHFLFDLTHLGVSLSTNVVWHGGTVSATPCVPLAQPSDSAGSPNSSG
jgi:hypothetical protein